jgi:hypothetical protein
VTEQVELWMPPAGTERGCLTHENIQWLTKQRMEALGISEEFLTSRCDVDVSFFEASMNNRLRVSNLHSEAMRKAFERTYKRIMSPRLFCRAVPGGAMLFGVRFRSLRKARIAFKAQIKSTKFKTLKSQIDPVAP